MLECPKCGKPEILRKELNDGVFVLFGCFFAATLPKLPDAELQQMLDSWERRGGMDEWLKEPLISPNTQVVIIKDPEIVRIAKEQFKKLWNEAKKFEETTK